MPKFLHKSEQYDLSICLNNDNICQLVLCPVAQNTKVMSMFIHISCVPLLLAVVETLVLDGIHKWGEKISLTCSEDNQEPG